VIPLLSKYREYVDKLFGEFGKTLSNFGITPNMITFVSFVCAIIVGITFALNLLVLAGVLTILTGFFDALDGATARATGRVTKFGGVFDAILDRYAEIIIFTGIILYGVSWLIGLLALAGSFLVSYTRARGEVLKIEMAGIGFAERFERLIILSAGAIVAYFIPQVLGFLTLELFVLVIAILVHFTAFHRFFYIWQQLKK